MIKRGGSGNAIGAIQSIIISSDFAFFNIRELFLIVNFQISAQ
jgi:hypothetical protein